MQKTGVTLKDFEDFIIQPGNRDRLFELVNGDIVEKVPTEQHGTIAANAATELNLYKRKHGGRVTVESRYRSPTDEHNDRLPDVAYTLAERLQSVVTQGAVLQIPDLVIEIKSPDDTYIEMREKALYYLKNDAKIAWLVFPGRREVEVHTPDKVTTLGIDDTLDGGDVLPGLALPVRVLFAE